MSEPTVQVPVSLIEALAQRADWDGSHVVAKGLRDALLSQPTPTAEPDAWERAAQIAERDAVGVTLSDLTQFPTVQATGARIAFNIRATAQKNGLATAEKLRSQGPHPKVTVLGRNDASLADAGPPRIEDMAPGTRFVAESMNGTTHYAEYIGGGKVRSAGLSWKVIGPDGVSRLDPSTIRDVQPPKHAA